MKKIAIVAVCVGALGLLACGGGGGDDVDAGGITFTDGSNDVDAPVAACNPVGNTGCEANQKCTFIIESTDPLLGYTGCADAGAVGIGGACTRSEVTGVDDCEGGLYCSDGICSEICTTAPDSCPNGFTCVHTSGIFEDDGIGMCNAQCGLHAQDCSNEETCYILLASEGYPTVCSPAVPEPNTANDGCVEVEKETPQAHGECCSYINTCMPRHGCVQPNRYGDGLVCSAFCDPTGTVSPAPPTCADFGIIAAGDHCLSIANFYTDVPDLDLTIGFCLIAEDWGPGECFNETQDANEDGVDCCTEGGNEACPCQFSCG